MGISLNGNCVIMIGKHFINDRLVQSTESSNTSMTNANQFNQHQTYTSSNTPKITQSRNHTTMELKIYYILILYKMTKTNHAGCNSSDEHSSFSDDSHRRRKYKGKRGHKGPTGPTGAIGPTGPAGIK